MKKEVTLFLILLIILTSCTYESTEEISTYDELENCVEDCTGLGFEGGVCAAEGPNGSMRMASCRIEGSEDCPDHGVCSCWCY